MSGASPRFEMLLAAARRRRVLQVTAWGAPWLLAALVWSWQFATGSATALIAIGGLGLLFAGCVLTLRRFNARWLARRLDAMEPALEDSAALFAERKTVESTLDRLQRARMQPRLERLERINPGPVWQPLPMLSSAITALVLAASALRLADASIDAALSSAKPVAEKSEVLMPPRIVKASVLVTPPTYTGLTPRTIDALDVRAPVGSRLNFSLRIAPRPESVELRWRDGPVLALREENSEWKAPTVLRRSNLLQLVTGLDPEPDTRLHRLIAIPDTAPRVRLLEPSRTLIEIGADTAPQRLEYVATDDYGILDAVLEVKLVQGSGETIRVQARSVTLAGSGPRTARRFAHLLDPRGFAMQPDADLIAQLVVRDVRQPSAQVSRSPSVILRWPAPVAEFGTELEGVVQKVLPAYFRSQRQIIVDTEALIAERNKLQAAVLLERSDRIGVDQRLLRLRYGQFLGEESEGAPTRPGAIGHDHEEAPDVSPAATSAAGPRHAATAAESANPLFADSYVHGADAPAPEPDAQPGQHADEHSDERTGVRPDIEVLEDALTDAGSVAGFGKAEGVVAEFGHAHDLAEAATLLDPATQKLLRAALAEMWQSELKLRQGIPVEALPFEYRALRFIKEVQQADRIYLPKMGMQSQPIDASRRLTGKRDGIRDRPDPLPGPSVDDLPLRNLWRTLGELTVPAGATVESRASSLEAAGISVEAWLLAHDATSEATLETLAALDAWRESPACASCREELRKRLWTRLNVAAVGVARRQAPDAVSRTYLEALSRTQEAADTASESATSPRPGAAVP